MQNYYGNILKILKDKHISQREFAKKIDVPKSSLNNWIIGISDPPLEVLLRTADFLDISIDEVIFERYKK